MAPIFADFAKQMPYVTFLKVDVDEVKTVTQEYSVESVPTFLFFKNGEVVDKVKGKKKDDLHACIVKHSGAAAITWDL
ncbi:putative monodehydroascorbate reductase (NADH) [Helianthus debilis subsp. tardiflorus]